MGRSKGEGSIGRYKSGTYYIRFKINGKDIKHSLDTKDPSKVEAKAKKYIKEHRNILNAKTKEELALQVQQARGLVRNTKAIEIQDGFELFKNSKLRKQETSTGTLKNYKCYYNRFAGWCIRNNITILNHVSDKNANDYFEWLDKEYSLASSTYNYHKVALTLIYNIVLPGVHNPFDCISRKTEVQKEHYLFSMEEISCLLEFFSNNNVSILNKNEMELIFKFSICTGARLADCCLLKKQYINTDEMFASYMPIKTKRYKRKVIAPINEKLMKELSEQTSDSDFLFPLTAERYKRNPSGIKSDIRKIFVDAGIKKPKEYDDNGNLKYRYRDIENKIIGFHCFRHYFITKCVENDMNVVKLSKIVGDNVKTLEKYYIRLREKAIMKEIDKMPVF